MNKLEELEGECKLDITDALNSFGRRCYEAGAREVVEDIKRILVDVVVGKRVDKLEKLLYTWQAKLKEKGIPNP